MSKKRVAILVAAASVVTLVAVLALGIPTSAAERTARSDVAALSAAIADYVAVNGRLPRVTVRPGLSGGGDAIWGADFLVEERPVPRADPTNARIFFLVGDADRWCVEALYIPPTLFSDSSGKWVLAKGEGSEAGKVVDGHCGSDYVLELSAVSPADVPNPGTRLAAASAPEGTCFANPLSAGDPLEALQIEVVACASPHHGEVFFAGDTSASDYSSYEDMAAGSCAAELESFIGIPRNLSALTAEPATVDRDAWDNGARGYTCILFLSAYDYALVGSARDSWR